MTNDHIYVCHSCGSIDVQVVNSVREASLCIGDGGITWDQYWADTGALYNVTNTWCWNCPTPLNGGCTMKTRVISVEFSNGEGGN